MSLMNGYPPAYKQSRLQEWQRLAMYWTAYARRDSFHRSALQELEHVVLTRVASLPIEEPSLVDLGCGSGVFLQRLKHATHHWQRLVGIDFCPRMVEFARNLDVSGIPRLTFIDADLEVPMSAAHARQLQNFDIATAAFLLDEVEEPGTCFSWAARMLRPGGVLICCTLDYDREVQRHAVQIDPKAHAGPIVIGRPMFVESKSVAGQYYRVLRTTAELERIAQQHALRLSAERLLPPSALGSRPDGPSLRLLTWSSENK